MREFNYTITDPQGIHARPAGLLVKKAGNFKSSVKLICGDKSSDCKKLFAVMGLGVKCGSEIKITADGEDEESAVSELKKFLEENL